MPRSRPSIIFILIVLVAAGTGGLLYRLGSGSGETSAIEPVPESVTFTEHVAPIVYENCAECHRPGRSGPFPLLTHQDCRKHARQIAEVTESGFMPPWLPDTDKNQLIGERGLSDREIKILRRWHEQGAPRGDPGHLPSQPTPPEKWPLGEPDLVARMPKPYVLKADGKDVYRNFVIRIPVSEPRYVRAVDLDPGKPKIVHHAVMQVDRSGTARQLCEQNDRPGYGGGMVLGEAKLPGGQFLGWTPGKTAFPGYDEIAWRVEPGTDLVLQLHLRPSGKPEPVQATVAFYFADQPPSRHPYSIVLRNKEIDIPAGATNHVVRESYRLPVDAEALMVYPHAHYLCKEMKAYVTFPDGSRRWLIHIPRWDFNWQDAYRYKEPIPLRAGSVIEMEYTYDNSADNIFNPNYPPKRVTYGPQSSDEMAELLLQVLPQDPSDLTKLKRHGTYRALVNEAERKRRHLKEHPDDAAAYNALGSLCLRLQRPKEALQAFEATLEIPVEEAGAVEHAIAHNELAKLARRQGNLDDAIGHYHQALRHRQELGEDHNTARASYLLGNALAQAGRFDGAVKQFREANRLKSGQPQILNALARALILHPDPEVRAPDEAAAFAKKAVAATEKKDPRMLETLAMAEAARQHYRDAIEAIEAAIKLASRHGMDRYLSRLKSRRANIKKASSDDGDGDGENAAAGH